MKTLTYLLLTTGMMLASYQTASAQCYNHPGFLPKAVGPGFDRYYQFQIEGRAFAFDRQTGDIFCSGLKIGVRTPDGQVQLDNAAVARLEGNAGVAPVGGQPGPAGQPAGGPPAPVGQPGPAGQPAVNGGAPAVGAPAPAAPVNGAAAPARAQGQAAPAASGIPAPAAGSAPAAAGAIPAPGTIPAIPNLGSTDPINPAFTGVWRAENKNILGRSTLRELTIEGTELTLRVQTGGDEAQLIEGKMELDRDNKLTVKGANGDVNLGAVSVANGQLVLAGDETLTFNRVEE